jgi:hypothetical protein
MGECSLGWHTSKGKTKRLTCPTCLGIVDAARQIDVPTKCQQFMDAVDPGELRVSDGGACYIRCHRWSCLRTALYLSTNNPCKNGWVKCGSLWSCPMHAENEYPLLESPAPLHIDGSVGGGRGFGVLARHVVILTNKLNAASYAMKPDATLPTWLLVPTDRNLNIAGKYNPEGKCFSISGRVNTLSSAINYELRNIPFMNPFVNYPLTPSSAMRYHITIRNSYKEAVVCLTRLIMATLQAVHYFSACCSPISSGFRMLVASRYSACPPLCR